MSSYNINKTKLYANKYINISGDSILKCKRPYNGQNLLFTTNRYCEDICVQQMAGLSIQVHSVDEGAGGSTYLQIAKASNSMSSKVTVRSVTRVVVLDRAVGNTYLIHSWFSLPNYRLTYI